MIRVEATIYLLLYNLHDRAFKEKFTILLLINVSNIYLRFIDGVFLIWNGTKPEFVNFLKKMNVI